MNNMCNNININDRSYMNLGSLGSLGSLGPMVYGKVSGPALRGFLGGAPNRACLENQKKTSIAMKKPMAEKENP